MQGNLYIRWQQEYDRKCCKTRLNKATLQASKLCEQWSENSRWNIRGHHVRPLCKRPGPRLNGDFLYRNTFKGSVKGEEDVWELFVLRWPWVWNFSKNSLFCSDPECKLQVLSMQNDSWISLNSKETCSSFRRWKGGYGGVGVGVGVGVWVFKTGKFLLTNDHTSSSYFLEFLFEFR